jgi:hypothetical protein
VGRGVLTIIASIVCRYHFDNYRVKPVQCVAQGAVYQFVVIAITTEVVVRGDHDGFSL